MILSLGADQHKKVIDKVNQLCGQIISIYLDKIKNLDTANEIIKCTLLLPNDTKKTVLIFVSPQTIVDKPHWKKFLKDLLT